MIYKQIIIFFLLLSGNLLQAQTYEEWLKQEKEQQNEMVRNEAEGLEKLRKEYDDFVKKRDREFAGFLKKRWIEFKIFKGELQPSEPKPREVPVVLKNSTHSAVILKSRLEESGIDRLPLRPLPRIRKSKDSKTPLIQGMKCVFYGTEFTVNADKALCRVYQGKLDEAGFSNYWLKTSECDYDGLLDQLFNLKQQLGLNDWGYYMLVRKCAETLLEEENSSQILTWFLLNKSGYIARIGYDKEKVAVLLPACQQIFELPYITGEGERYYITRSLDKIFTYDGNFSGSDRKMDLRFTTALNFPDQFIKRRKLSFQDTVLTLTYNQKVIDFYNDYPPTEWEVYFNAPVSASAKESLATNLRTFLNQENTEARIAFLLKFLHQSFPYQTDEEQFGKEKYFFPEEILAYPYSDCEDRAVFFAYLERTFVGLPVVGLSYPGHVSTAVKKTDGLNGDYISYRNEKYIACDPTYIGASPGMSMPRFKNTEAAVIPVEGVLISRELENRLAEEITKAGGVILNREKHIFSDGSGNIYVAGMFRTMFHMGNDPESSRGHSLFLSKMNKKGEIIWSLTFGGKENNMLADVKMIGNDILLSGTFEGEARFGAITLQAARPDVFLLKIDTDGKIVWASEGDLPGVNESIHYIVGFDRNGKALTCSVQPDAWGMPLNGIVFTRQNEYVVTGNLGPWNSVRMARAEGKQNVLIADVAEQLKELSDVQLKQNADRSIAGLLAVISLINTQQTPVSGEIAVRTLDKYNPGFKKRCPAIYKNIRNVDFIKKEDGIIQLKTRDGKAVSFDKVQVKDGSRMRATLLPEENVLIEIIDGIKVGKAFIWFKLNNVTLFRSTGDMMFDYDTDHTLKTFNLGKDILN